MIIGRYRYRGFMTDEQFEKMKRHSKKAAKIELFMLGFAAFVVLVSLFASLFT